MLNADLPVKHRCNRRRLLPSLLQSLASRARYLQSVNRSSAWINKSCSTIATHSYQPDSAEYLALPTLPQGITRWWGHMYDGPIGIEFCDLVIAADATFGYSHDLQRVSGTLKGGQKAAFWVRVTDCLPQNRRPVARGSRTCIRADEPRDGRGGARPHALNGE